MQSAQVQLGATSCKQKKKKGSRGTHRGFVFGIFTQHHSDAASQEGVPTGATGSSCRLNLKQAVRLTVILEHIVSCVQLTQAAGRTSLGRATAGQASHKEQSQKVLLLETDSHRCSKICVCRRRARGLSQ